MLRDGVTSPASDLLDDLKAGERRDDLDHIDGDPWPDEAQPSDFHKIMAMVKKLADDGEPIHGHAINSLHDGIWEFKRGKKRVSFFDTDGEGNINPKLRIRDRSACEDPDYVYWWFPEFDQQIRLGHVFMKDSQLAASEDIAETLRVREEDLAHDKQTDSATAIQPINH